MAGFAHITGIDMRPALAGCGDVVMAGNAIAGKGRMVHHRHRHPGRNIMARITFNAGRDVPCALAGRNTVVMAGRAHANHSTMIHC